MADLEQAYDVMRTFISMFSLLLIFASDTTAAQVDRKPRDRTVAPKASALSPATEQTPDEIRARGRQWFAQCMADWDLATHMSKKDWARTCRRVAVERTKFLMNEQGKK